LRLLVVDDEADVCDFVRNFFKERNFEVSVAYDGKKAVETVKTESPDIVLLDVKMPEMDGMEALKEILKIDASKKVIMITAVDDVDQIEEAKRCGAVEYITKPLILEQLERTVMAVAEQVKAGI